jgi:hypothetical protein
LRLPNKNIFPLIFETIKSIYILYKFNPTHTYKGKSKNDKIRTSFLEVKRYLFSRDMCDDQQETINSNKAKIIYIDMVRVLESDRNVVVARLKIHIGEFEERVKNYLATISEFKEENCKLADEKLKIEISYKSLCTKHRKLQERVSKLMEAGYQTFDEFRCFWWWKQ